MNRELHSVTNGHLQLIFTFSFLYKPIDQYVFAAYFELIVAML
jgi:hypothetical protein